MEDGGQAGEWGKRGLKREEGKERKRRAGRTNKSLGPVLPKDAADAMAAHPLARGRGHKRVQCRKKLMGKLADPPGRAPPAVAPPVDRPVQVLLRGDDVVIAGAVWAALGSPPPLP